MHHKQDMMFHLVTDIDVKRVMCSKFSEFLCVTAVIKLSFVDSIYCWIHWEMENIKTIDVAGGRGGLQAKQVMLYFL